MLEREPYGDVLLDPKQNCKCSAPPSGPILFVASVDFLADSDNTIYILIGPIVLVQYMESHKLLYIEYCHRYVSH